MNAGSHAYALVTQSIQAGSGPRGLPGGTRVDREDDYINHPPVQPDRADLRPKQANINLGDDVSEWEDEGQWGRRSMRGGAQANGNPMYEAIQDSAAQ